jgi:hypothetical protein
MGHYNRYEHKRVKRQEMSPIWRGIGCILMVVVPLVSYALTAIVAPYLITTGYVPLELLGHIIFPAWLYRLPILRDIASFFGGINNLGLGIVVFIVIIVLLTGLFSLLFAAIMQLIGPPRYSEMDAPPSKHKAKVYKR